MRAQLESACRGLALAGGRLIPPENLHATLVFLGTVDAARRPCIEWVLATVPARAFEVALTELAWRRQGGIVWLAAPCVPAALEELVTALNAALGGCGHTPERRPYRLHVTVARNVRRAPRRRTIAPVQWRVSALCLVSSVPAPAGSVYTVERRRILE